MFSLWALISSESLPVRKGVLTLSLTLSDMKNYTILTLVGSQTILNSLVRMAVSTKVALDFLLAGQGGVCAIF